jgi:hypothetical protein
MMKRNIIKKTHKNYYASYCQIDICSSRINDNFNKQFWKFLANHKTLDFRNTIKLELETNDPNDTKKNKFEKQNMLINWPSLFVELKKKK